MLKNLKNKKKKGFTLIEIIAVIAIIAILAAVLVPKVLGYMTEAKKPEVIDQARKVVTAAESYQLKTGKTEADTNTISITDMASKSGGLLITGDITKIGLTENVGTCRKIVNSKSYVFEVDPNTGNYKTGTAKELQ